jgi:hypothetical protein
MSTATIIATQELAIVAGLVIHRDLDVCGVEKLQGMTHDELVALVKDANSKATKAAKQTLLHVGQTGIALIYLKERMGHGKFMRYVECQTGISQRTANNYMAIARHYGNVSNLRGVSDALGYIRKASGNERASLPWALPCKASTPTPPTSIEAEIAEPDRPTADEAKDITAQALPANDDPEPDALVVDGSKDRPAPAPPASHIPEQEPVVADGTKEDGKTEKQPRLSKFIPDDAGRLWTLARTDLDKILKSDRSRERVLREIIEYCQTRLAPKRPVAEVEAITAMLPHLTKDELAKLKRAIAVQWETLTGKAVEQ